MPPWKESPHGSSANKKSIMQCKWEVGGSENQTFEAHSIVTFWFEGIPTIAILYAFIASPISNITVWCWPGTVTISSAILNCTGCFFFFGFSQGAVKQLF